VTNEKGVPACRAGWAHGRGYGIKLSLERVPYLQLRPQTEANAVAAVLLNKAGKKVVLHHAGLCLWSIPCRRGWRRRPLDWEEPSWEADLSPLGTTDFFPSYLIKAQAAKPDVIIFTLAGDDMVNALKAGGAVRFWTRPMHLGGAQQETGGGS